VPCVGGARSGRKLFRDVIHLPPEFDAPAFLQSERPYESHAEIKVTGADDASSPEFPMVPRAGAANAFRLNHSESGRPEWSAIRSPPTYCGQLVTDVGSVPRVVVTAGGCDVMYSPSCNCRWWTTASRTQITPQHGLLESRRLEDRRKVEKAAGGRSGNYAPSISVADIRIGNGGIRSGVPGLIALERSEAVGPGIVSP